MDGIIDKITEFIKELLQGWVLTNFETMFTDVNDKVGPIAGEVSKTPSTWNCGIFDMIKTLSDNVMIPIAGMIISFVLVYELISMVIDKNNLHDFNTAIFIRFFMKACIAVMLLSKTFDIVMAVFDVGSHIVNSAAVAISGETSIDVSSTLQTMLNEQFSEMSIGELLGLGMETMIVSLCMKIMSVLITVILYGRMIEIYLYVSVAPVPCATVTNREWGTIGTNYFKGLCALAFQGFFMMVCVAIYAVLVAAEIVDVVVSGRGAQVQMIANDIRSGNVKPLQIFLQTSIDGRIDEDSERQAKELIAKLAEYKPLAKIEELEEQNYNMNDDRLNNGVEKFNHEEEKKEQAEKPQARTSLKERLAAKQTEVAQGKKDSKEQNKAKKTNREEI